MQAEHLKRRLLATSVRNLVIAASLTAACASGVASAQDYTSGDLTGRVRDDAGVPVAGATVIVRSPQGLTRQARSDSDGVYRITALPAGAYTAQASAVGLADAAPERVTLRPGGSSVVFTLARAGAASELVVTRRTGTVQSFERVESGLSLDVQQLAERTPLARDIGAVTLRAPSVSLSDPTINAGARRPGQNLVSIAGASAAEQVYYVNGLNVTDQRSFLGFADLPFEAVQSVDVKTGGYGAEFGRATGGVINIVTRSGSNELHAGASLYYAPDSLRADAKDAYNAQGLGGALTLNSAQRSSVLDTNVYLSGPIVRDRLFFFGVINPRSAKSEDGIATAGLSGPAAASGTQVRTQTDSPRWLTKFDLNLTDRQRIEATIFSDAAKLYRTSYQGSETGGFAAPATIASKSGGLQQIYRYTGAWTDWLTLSALYGRLESQYTDASDSFGIPLVQDLTQRPSPANPTGAPQFLTGVTRPGPFEMGGKDRRETYRVDADVYFRLFGEHHIRVGYDDERLRSTTDRRYSGGFYQYLLNTASTPIPSPPPPGRAPYTGDYAVQFVFNSTGAFEATQAAAYLQDSWRITPDLTLQLGVRNDVYDYKTVAGESFIKTDDQWAPRLGFAWDPRGLGQDKVYGAFGRYYLPIAMNTALLLAGSSPSLVDFYQISRDPSGNLLLNPNGTAVLGPMVARTFVLHGAQPPSPGLVASADIEPMFSEEYVLGYEHTFRDARLLGGWLDGVKVGVSYIDRSLRQTIEDTQLENNGSGPFYRYCARTGTSCRNAPFAYSGQFTLFNPGRPVVVEADLAGTGTPQRIELTNADLGGMPEAKNHYQAVEFTFERPFDGRWELGGSYVLARSRGNYEGAVKSDTGQLDPSITQDFDLAFFTRGANGYLPNDHRHTIKLWGSYSPIENLLLGANLFAQSGRRFGCLGYIGDPSVDPAPSATPVQWFCPLGPQIGATPGGVPLYATVATPRGSQHTTPWVTQLDLKVAYSFPTPTEFGRARVELAVFNVLNNQAETRIVEQGALSTQPNIRVMTYGQPRSYQAPRYVRFGVSYAY